MMFASGFVLPLKDQVQCYEKGMSDSSTVQGGTSLAPAFHWAGGNFGTFDSVVFWNSYSICITKVFFFFVAL